ncbi:proline iminopeptidase-family hydrolase [Mucilaginibacter sp. HC2]|uniref:proline iminopeptidase-family hydrolase n=1 Tax=Mucilaginibacter inviolabilis TaxID=2714892 RepID=UPI0014090699|nr:proline iminopeptidase-family hydrolase [Mucilaginibacter inviolabilis]NHA03872.1 proline iminopeptidase-family hydrolase [Mucilaginibacter inviolabilis]
MATPFATRNIRTYFIVPLLLLITLVTNAQEKDSTYYKKQQEPGVKKILINGKFWVWTQKIGDGKINVLLLHGGPAQSHEYFEIFSKYLPNKGITIYYYDQFGSYFSEQPTPQQLNDTSIWKVSRYVEEIEQVRKGLNLDHFFIYGHSFGSLLALAYTYQYQTHVKGMIFSDMNPFPKDFDQRISSTSAQTDSILNASPKFNSLMQNKQKGLSYDQNIYQKAFDSTFTRTFVLRLDKLPDAMLRTKLHKNMEVARKIGPSTFSLDYAGMISKITVPVLLIRGEYDFIISTGQLKKLNTLFAKSQYYVVPNAGHICFIDNPDQYFPGLIAFIKHNN